MLKYLFSGLVALSIQNIQSMQPQKPPADKIDVQIINETGNLILVTLKSTGTKPSVGDLEKYAYQKITLPKDMIGLRKLDKRLLPKGIFDIQDFTRDNSLEVEPLDVKGFSMRIPELRLETARIFGIFEEPGTAIFTIKSAPNNTLTQTISYNKLSLQAQQRINEGEAKKAAGYEPIMGLTQKIGAWRRVLDLINDETKPTISEQDVYNALDIDTKNLDPEQKAKALLNPSTFGLATTESWREVYKRLLRIFHSDFFSAKGGTAIHKANLVNTMINNANDSIKG